MKIAAIISLLTLAGAASGLLFQKYWPEAPFPVILLTAILLTAAAFKFTSRLIQ